MPSSKKLVDEPKMPAHLERVPFDPYEVEDEYEISGRSIADAEFSGHSAYRTCFVRSTFTNVAMRGTSLRKAEFTDVVFERCDLSNAILQEASFYRVVFKDCKLIGLDMTDCTLRNVTFIDCNGEYGVFRMTDIKRVKLEGGSFAYSDFFNSNLTEFYLRNTKLEQAQFSQTKLAGVDLSSCEFDSLGATLQDLRGCIISPMQAAVFAGQFGMVVKR
ncbi:pentapeptide repeat-containing protein [Paenibacillus sp. NEAU-GSW1]|uniref:pentapeptide repeat-containing protein n=1 Tax=Paenibacillus sp. NEAU-GSW1 TaxID=2682486 RepID=UPI001565C84D|nr:pentapeptide repeat-containing protein [Paenibacillus sp. NEAU-GSW1]